MLSSAGLAVLGVLHNGGAATPAELAVATEHSQKHLYEVLDTLMSAGILTESRGNKNQRRVQVTEHPVVEAYRALQANLGHVDWAALLSPATIRVCWYLDEPRRVTEIASRLDITRQGVYNALNPLKGRALLSPSGPKYALSAELDPLLGFVRAVVRHDHHQRLQDCAPSALIEWCDPKRALVSVQTPDDTDALQSASEWQLTGLARFQEYGLQFYLGGEPAFWYGPDAELTPAQVVCHTLIRDHGSRHVSYGMVLCAHLDLDRETMVDTARWYNLEPVVTAMYRALDGDFDISTDIPLPSKREFVALKEQYGVA